MNREIDAIVKQLQDKAERATVIGSIYDATARNMEWDAMCYHSADEDHSEGWYTVPEPDDYNYNRYQVYQEVLAMLLKLAES